MAPETFNETSNRRSRPMSGTAGAAVGVGGPGCVTSCHFPDATASPAREY